MTWVPVRISAAESPLPGAALSGTAYSDSGSAPPDRHLVPGRLQLDPPQLHPDLPQRVFQLRGAAAFPKGPYGHDQERPNGEGEDGPQIF